MTRKEIETAVGRLLGSTSSESIFHEVQSSILRAREVRSNPRPSRSTISEFVDTLTRRRMTNSVLKRLRVAVANVARNR